MTNEKQILYSGIWGRGRWAVGIAIGRDLWYVRVPPPATGSSGMGEARVYLPFGTHVAVYRDMWVFNISVLVLKLSFAWGRRP